MYHLTITPLITLKNKKKEEKQMTNSGELMRENDTNYDRTSELKAFDDTKTGVRGLVEAGVSKIPRIFVHRENKSLESYSHGETNHNFSLPIISLEGVHQSKARRKVAVEKISNASQNWGFFRVIDHGIPPDILDGMVEGVRRFHEQDPEIRKKYYSRDIVSGKLAYNANFDLFKASVAHWIDSFYCLTYPNPPNPQELPEICRYVYDFAISLLLRTCQVLY